MNDTITPDYERRRKAINEFAVAVLKNIQNFANSETKKKIQKYLKEQENRLKPDGSNESQSNNELLKDDDPVKKEMDRQREENLFPPIVMMNDKFAGNPIMTYTRPPKKTPTQTKGEKEAMVEVNRRLMELIKKVCLFHYF